MKLCGKFLILLIIFIIIYFCNYEVFSNIKKELVICVYREDINWINNIIDKYDKIYIYIKNNKRITEVKNKFKHKKIKIIELENIGSCDHAYLYHIINNYNNLSDIVVFSKGTYRKNIHKYNINKNNTNKTNNFLKKFKLNNWTFSHNKTDFKYIKSNYSNLNEYLESLFDKHFVSKLFNDSDNWLMGGYFSLDKNNILRYPIYIYKKLINYKIKHPNREIDHFQERIWGLLFSNKTLFL